MQFLARLIGTFFYTGFFPIAPATFASLVFALAYWFVPGGEMLAHPLVALVTLVLSVPAATILEKQYGHDAGRIVIDEVVGMQVILALAQPTLSGLAVAFFIWRAADVIKPWPARQAQDWPRGWGVVADDVFAAIYTRVAMIVLAYFVPALGSFA
jgi:phosphatidylglycerophosphatase A